MSADLTSIFASIASIFTILQFLTGILTCLKIVRKRSTGDMSAFAFISGHLSTSLWLRYGFLIDNFSLIFVNTIGSVLFLGYVLVFYYYSTRKMTVLRQFAGCLLLLSVALIYSKWSDNYQDVKTNMGLLSCLITIVFFAAPLTSLFHVIRIKSSESLPFPIIAANFVVSSLWYIYGVLLDDTFIQIPNFLGSILSLFQLCLFCVFPSKHQDIESI